VVARQDLTLDPALQAQLLIARRGTAFFARKLNELRDADLDAPSLLPGWTRRHVIAHVSYNARAIARLIEWANSGVENPMYASPEERNEEIDFGATLSPTALRNLFSHSAIHLNVEWRDTPPEAWSHEVRTAQGRTVPASETVWMRTREVWVHAVDLDNGASFDQIPGEVLERLLQDISGAWQKRGEGKNLRLSVTGTPNGGTPDAGDPDAGDPDVVAGSLPELAAWASGRGARGVSSRRQPERPAPRWM
jgi:maleylpyruvate isomerase